MHDGTRYPFLPTPHPQNHIWGIEIEGSDTPALIPDGGKLLFLLSLLRSKISIDRRLG